MSFVSGNSNFGSSNSTSSLPLSVSPAVLSDASKNLRNLKQELVELERKINSCVTSFDESKSNSPVLKASEEKRIEELRSLLITLCSPEEIEGLRNIIDLFRTILLPKSIVIAL